MTLSYSKVSEYYQEKILFAIKENPYSFRRIFLYKQWSDCRLMYFEVDAFCPLEIRLILYVAVLNYFKLSLSQSASTLLSTNILDYIVQVTEIGEIPFLCVQQWMKKKTSKQNKTQTGYLRLMINVTLRTVLACKGFCQELQHCCSQDVNTRMEQ